MSAGENAVDTGTAYGMKPLTHKTQLTEVGRGKPMGELMRRYWQPIMTSADLSSERPFRVRILGENLIAFRDKSGRPGLVYEHCFHRGTSLFFGRIEEDGIRCCNHGWKFDTKGNCLDQPAEVAGGARSRGRVRQPWYPVEERYGLVFAYMGPPEKKPVLPRWEHLENLGQDEYIEIRTKPGYGPLDRTFDQYTTDFNWLPAIEQTLDGTHVPWLHYNHSGDQFTGVKLVEKEDVDPPPYGRVREIAQHMVAERSQCGVLQGFPMPAPDGTLMLSCNETIVPNVGIVPGFFDMMFVVPVDDVNYTAFILWRSKKGATHEGIEEMHDGKTWWEMTELERRAMPGDYEAQSSIVAPANSYEHFVSGDVAISLFRRRLEESLKDIEEGRDPPGVNFDEAGALRKIDAFALRPMRPEEMKGKFEAA